MIRILTICCLFIGLSLDLPAGPVSPSTFYEFSFTDPGVSVTGCLPNDPAGNFCISSSGTPTTFADAPPWTISLPSGGLLLVTDAFVSGDSFEILDFGVPIGMTSAFIPDTDCGDDPVPCLANPGMSHAEISLAAGNHSLMIVPLAVGALGGGSGYFVIIPEPHIGVLAAAGLAFLALRRNRQRRQN